MSDVAQALGLKLKAERERRGVSAQKMADDMHLDGWVIEALEAGDYQRIGPAVYAKGHLKKYAALLGVSAVDSPAAPDAKQPAVGSAGPDHPPGSAQLRRPPAGPCARGGRGGRGAGGRWRLAASLARRFRPEGACGGPPEPGRRESEGALRRGPRERRPPTNEAASEAAPE